MDDIIGIVVCILGYAALFGPSTEVWALGLSPFSWVTVCFVAVFYMLVSRMH